MLIAIEHRLRYEWAAALGTGRSVLDAGCGVGYGLRSLAPSDPQYRGSYTGDPRSRDGAYHQGTVWAWLLGPFAIAHYRVYQNCAAAQGLLEPLGRTIYSAGLGPLSEIFGADAPYPPAGCTAQAWSVAELVRAWTFLCLQSDKEG